MCFVRAGGRNVDIEFFSIHESRPDPLAPQDQCGLEIQAVDQVLLGHLMMGGYALENTRKRFGFDRIV